jgi:hypothetical protein
MSDITWKDVLEMQHLLTSIDFLELLDERLDTFSDLWFGKWSVVNTDIIICMKRNCTITIYKKVESILTKERALRCLGIFPWKRFYQMTV